MKFEIGQKVEVINKNCLANLIYNNLPNIGVVVECFPQTPIDTILVEFISNKGKLKLAFYPEQLKVVNSFNSQQEIWEYLIAGGKVHNINTRAILELNNGTVYSEGKTLIPVQDITFSNFEFYTKYVKAKEVNWYDNIPKSGVLCWVYDREDQLEDKITDIIAEYIPTDIEPFLAIDGKTSWRCAVPLTQEEVDKLISKPMIEIEGIQ